ncbi:MAG TPA: hypothetical protein VFW15_16460, partial [Thermoanaerobaculia bacterium]|nr:hypothetical protein [Thermoanaerobaculia bacterium]
YSGGRIIALTFLLIAPFLAWSVGATRRRRALLLAALLLGFVVAALPNLRFAAEHFHEWNGRFQESSIFAPWFWKSEVPRLGATRVLIRQFHLGTIGLLSLPGSAWFSGHPLIGPPLFTALGLAGLGWVFARRQLIGGTVLALLFAGNLAGIILTTGTPAPQRASSLVPVLAILGGVAIGGVLELFPEADRRSLPWRAFLALLLVGAYVARSVPGYPLDPGKRAAYGGVHSAFGQEASKLLLLPGFRSERAFLHGLPHVDTRFPTFAYFLPAGRLVDADVQADEAVDLPPGLHVYSPELMATGRRRAEAMSSRNGLSLADPADPLREIGYVVRVRRSLP